VRCSEYLSGIRRQACVRLILDLDPEPYVQCWRVQHCLVPCSHTVHFDVLVTEYGYVLQSISGTYQGNQGSP
jgi:hypothetical protein